MSLPITGHAGNEIRTQFCQMLELLASREIDHTDPLVHRLTGRLWSCTDVVPGSSRNLVDVEGVTYAQVARSLRRLAR